MRGKIFRNNEGIIVLHIFFRCLFPRKVRDNFAISDQSEEEDPRDIAAMAAIDHALEALADY